MASVTLSKKKIAVMLTDSKAGSLVSKLLVARGFEVVAPGDLVNAPNWAVRPAIDTLLVDFELPGGIEAFFARMKEIDNAAAVLVADLQPSVERALAARQHGAFDYLTYPFSAPDLVDAINRSLARLQSLRKRHVLLDAYLVANGAVPPSDEEPTAEDDPGGKATDVLPVADSAAVESVAAAPTAGGRESVWAEERALLEALVEKHAVPRELADRAGEELVKAAAQEDGPVSALRELEILDENLADRIISSIADLANVPPVDLSVVDYSAAMLAKCDRRLLRLYSAVPIGRIGDVRLVAMANPFSELERGAVRSAMGGECRFYVCSGLAAAETLEEPEGGEP